MTQHEDEGNQGQHDGDHAIQGLRLEPRRPSRSEPSAEETAREQVHDNGPLRGDGPERHCDAGAERVVVEMVGVLTPNNSLRLEEHSGQQFDPLWLHPMTT